MFSWGMTYKTIYLPKSQSLSCEVVSTSKELAQGLMFRKSLDKNKGMLFIFPYKNNWSFWMKNTLIPLDIIWLDEKKEIIHLQKHALPCLYHWNCTHYTPPSSCQAKYVIEVNAGFIQQHQLIKYSRINF
jgi:uncharacterized membrane protein (UPF0127 family)